MRSSGAGRPAAAILARKISRISARLRWIAGHQDVAGQVVAELDDQLGQVGLPGGDALGGQRLVEPDLLGGHRLDLDDLVDAVARGEAGDDRVGLVGVAGPVHRARRGR